MFKKNNRCFSLFIISLLFSFFPAYSFANNSKGKTVRVGWYQSDMFQEGMSDDTVKSGYCYDYLQNLADYTEWKYEYVYGEWPELIEKLEKGEIDLLGGVSYSEERAETMLFPDAAMATDQYYLYKRSDDTSIAEDDITTLNGKKVGVIKSNRMTVFAKQWFEQNNLDLEIILFDSFSDEITAFQNKEIDLLTQTIFNILSFDNISIVSKIGEEPFYIAVSKQSEELFQELNTSLATMLSIAPFLLQNLQYKNYGSTLSNRTLTPKEKDWVSKHTSITVGYLDDFLPYSGTTATGKATGIVTDVLEAILESLELKNKIHINYCAYNNYQDIMTDLKSGVIDVAFPVYGDFWTLDLDGINATNSVVSCRETFFYKGNYAKENIKRVAINENNTIQLVYSKKVFPDAEYCFYPSIYDCFKAIKNGDADGTVINTLRSQLVTGNSKYKGLNYIQLDMEDSKCFGLSKNNTTLLLLINRGLRIIGPSYGIDNSYKYISELFTYTGMDFIRDNVGWIGLVLLLISTIIFLTLIHSLRQKDRNVKAMDLLNTQMEASKRIADKANKAKTNFLFNMSHDIRTPMNAIIGFANLMERDISNPEKLKEFIRKIKLSGEYLLTLINNVLEVARIDSGEETIDETFTDLMDKNCSVIPMLENEMEAKKITLDQHMNITHRYVWADMAKIREITMNIVSNAIKYTPEGGKISLQFNEVPSERPGYATYINTISDTGIGMSPEFIEHIFDSFSRERNTTESKIGGTGLGMSIVKKLIDILGGKIEVTSELGKGSTFVVTMDHRIIEQPERYIEEQRLLTKNHITDLKDKCFLLVEDNELNAEIGIAILEDLGAKVEHAADGVQCINMLLNHPPFHYDYVLMDIQMPNMNGYEATKRIRAFEDKEKSLIPIIAMTANAFDEDRYNALSAGMNAHLQKPVEVTKLLETLANL